LIPKKHKIIFLSFNKSIKEELKRKLPKNVRASTLHQLGKSMFYQNNLQNHVVDKKKMDNLIDKKLQNYDEPEKTFLTYFLRDTVRKVKLSMCDVTKEGIESLPNVYDDVTPLKLRLIQELLDESLSIPNVIDFSDMIWIPVKKQFQYTKYDWVFVDEVQDLSRTQFELIKLICDDHTRIITVGDSKQSMYGFRCADIDSMQNFKEYFDAKDYPLSICYRCPQKVVKMAQRIVPQIEPWEKSEDGIIKQLSFDQMIQEVDEGDMLICRTNAPLVKVVHQLIRMGKRAKIRGTDMQQRLFNTIKYMNPQSMDDLREKVGQRLIHYRGKLTPETEYHEKKRLEGRIDLHETLLYFMRDANNLLQLKDNIDRLYSEDGGAINCSTIHKVKGLEADRVFVYRYDLMPHPMANTDRELQEEKNIEYVAITRAKKELYLIMDPEW